MIVGLIFISSITNNVRQSKAKLSSKHCHVPCTFSYGRKSKQINLTDLVPATCSYSSTFWFDILTPTKSRISLSLEHSMAPTLFLSQISEKISVSYINTNKAPYVQRNKVRPYISMRVATVFFARLHHPCTRYHKNVRSSHDSPRPGHGDGESYVKHSPTSWPPLISSGVGTSLKWLHHHCLGHID